VDQADVPVGPIQRAGAYPVPATEGSKYHRLPATKDRAAIRSVTPPSFARAFFEANP
jgi:hypothetical protein